MFFFLKFKPHKPFDFFSVGMKFPLFSSSRKKSHPPFFVSRAREVGSCTASLRQPICVVLCHTCLWVLPHKHSPGLPSELRGKWAIPSSPAQSNTSSAAPKEKQLQDLLLISSAALLLSVWGAKVSTFEDYLSHWQKCRHHPASLLSQCAASQQPRPWQGLPLDSSRQLTLIPEHSDSQKVRWIQRNSIWKALSQPSG